ncbi:hypothetical protein S7711_10457 [Stachybotrys chartarum IBT 7711]|uniref:Zn(2)-C6 fungal-type domain-containing protein n=1 Tax=Stachybotrys chartarum (strain CBS 109288 / IBT 7711) TaxID=1280523 RepID=A0A084BBV5_STACB|nr:hypothetical protein S7711_10457 [Stachybotrys chartarum IBT 7711]KFA51914.1 hypothetical protein S40293_10784 [Stachybotrys chartarum IBT 40293]
MGFCALRLQVKCSYEKPHCQKCKASELPCEYPRGKRGKRRASVVSRGSERDSNHSGLEEDANSPPSSTTTAPSESASTAPDPTRSSSASSASSPPMPIPEYPMVSQHQYHPEGSSTTMRGGRQMGAIGTSHDMVMTAADMVAVADVTHQPPESAFYYPAMGDEEGRDVWIMEDKGASVPLDQSAWMGFHTAMTPMPTLPSAMSDVMTQGSTTGMSPIMVDTPPGLNNVSSTEYQALDGSKLMHSASASSLSELGSSYQCKCDAVVVELLEAVASARQISTLLETMTTVRGLLRRFHDIAQCPHCLYQASSTMMRVILSEKLMAQFNELLLSNKPLSGYGTAPGGTGFGSFAFGDYPLESGEERGEVFAGLLRHNVRLFIVVLRQLLERAQMKEWHHHVETLNELLVQASNLIGTTRADMKR